MKINARITIRQQARLRLNLERRLSQQMLSLFASSGNQVASFLENSVSYDNVLNELPRRLYTILFSHYSATIQKFRELQIQSLEKKYETYEDLVNQYLTLYGLEKITGISNTTRKQLTRIIQKGQEEGLGVVAIAKILREEMAGSFSRYRAATIARTETHSAANFANFQIAKTYATSNKMQKHYNMTTLKIILRKFRQFLKVKIVRFPQNQIQIPHKQNLISQNQPIQITIQFLHQKIPRIIIMMKFPFIQIIQLMKMHHKTLSMRMKKILMQRK